MFEDIMNRSEMAPIIIGKLLNIGGMLQRKGDKLLQEFNLNQQQFSILFEINLAGKIKQKDMVNRLLLEKPHVSKVVKKLQGMELITVTQTSEDKRAFWLESTAKGKEVVNKCREIFKDWNLDWASEIPENQLSDLMSNLGTLQSVFKSRIYDLDI